MKYVYHPFVTGKLLRARQESQIRIRQSNEDGRMMEKNGPFCGGAAGMLLNMFLQHNLQNLKEKLMLQGGARCVLAALKKLHTEEKSGTVS